MYDILNQLDTSQDDLLRSYDLIDNFYDKEDKEQKEDNLVII